MSPNTANPDLVFVENNMMHSKSEQQFVRHSCAPNRIIIDEDDFDLDINDDVVDNIDADYSDGGSSYKIRSRRIDNSNNNISNINSNNNNDNNNVHIHNNNSYKKPQRCMSLPADLHKIATRTVSIMITRTIDESLHSTYGSDEEGPTGRRRRSKDRLSLQFDKIKIREYSRTVGDNPSCSSGPPISISWEYNILAEMNLDDYENHRPPRRVRNEMVLPRAVRHEILRREWGASNKEIAEAVRMNVKVKNQRKTTVNNLDNKAAQLEEVIISASRKLRRIVTFKKSINQQVKDLEEQLDSTNRRRSKLLYLEQHNKSQHTNRGSSADTAPTENGVSDDFNDATNDPAVHVPRLQEGSSSNGNIS